MGVPLPVLCVGSVRIRATSQLMAKSIVDMCVHTRICKLIKGGCLLESKRAKRARVVLGIHIIAVACLPLAAVRVT